MPGPISLPQAAGRVPCEDRSRGHGSHRAAAPAEDPLPTSLTATEPAPRPAGAGGRRPMPLASPLPSV